MKRQPKVKRAFVIRALMAAPLTVALTLGSSHSARAGDKSIEFNSDPTQEDFERIIQPVINPIRQTTASPPGAEGGQQFAISTSLTTSTISDEADTLSKPYFKTGGVGRSMEMSRFNLYMHTSREGSAKQQFHAGLLLTAGYYPYSNQQLAGGSIIVGSDIASVRVGYATLYGSQEFAACSQNAELIVRIFEVPRIVAVYGGGGAAKTGAAAWWLTMSEKRSRVWFDRYGILGANIPVGTFLSGSDYAPISVGAEGQFSSSPKQTSISARASLNF